MLTAHLQAQIKWMLWKAQHNFRGFNVCQKFLLKCIINIFILYILAIINGGSIISKDSVFRWFLRPCILLHKRERQEWCISAALRLFRDCSVCIANWTLYVSNRYMFANIPWAVTKASSDEWFIFKTTGKAFCRLIPVYGSHCGRNKLGFMELVCLLHKSQTYAWNVRLLFYVWKLDPTLFLSEINFLAGEMRF